jgi:cell division protein FtsX
MTHKSKWLLLAPLGLVTVGAGACLIQWAGSLQSPRRPTGQWVAAGTLALSVFNAGLCLFGSGVAESVLYQLHEKPHSAAALPTDAQGTQSVGLG